ncbi:hypothetical protein W97_00810 [Coniosporium apollinis CBS 100218]|uniref:Uncharacterized protein n=1 Tax=Coniosporium apollinis (strain CBS 100218) TaxID=1168221 RepID=R7YI80_CONA1|nr:uncharacterized protein W97_00810 [Coniosporium apollinis CBS 100218]EON61595.1 hypothetical protein W97_00810 [Coniosporium apollinis CBS 100218]
MLNKNRLSRAQKDDLLGAFSDAWELDQPLSDGVENFLVNKLIPRSIQCISPPNNAENVVVLQSSCGRFLTDYTTGVDPFEISPTRPEMEMGDVMNAVHEYVAALYDAGEEWLVHWWTLYDVAWAAEAAVIQSCLSEVDMIATAPLDDSNVGNATSAGNGGSVKPDQVLALIFAQQDFGPNQPRHSNLVRSLTAALLDANDLQSFNGDKAPFAGIPGSFITRFTGFLGNRARRLRDCNGEVRALLNRFKMQVENWCGDASSLNSRDRRHIGGQYFPLFVVDCPKQHPIPSVILNDKLSPSQRNLFQNHQNTPEPFQLGDNVFCPYCDDANSRPIKQARLVQPLSFVFTALEDALDNGPANQYSSTRDPAEDDPQPPVNITPCLDRPFNPSMHFPDQSLQIVLPDPRDRPPSFRSSESNVSSTKGFKGIWNRFTNRSSAPGSGSASPKTPISPLPVLSASPLPNSLRFGFSASGRNALFWEGRGYYIVRIPMGPSPLQGQRLGLISNRSDGSSENSDKSRRLLAAAGDSCAAAVVSDQKVYKLFVFDAQGRMFEAPNEQLMDDGRSQIMCVAMSCNDILIALGFGNKVHLHAFSDDKVLYKREFGIHTPQAGQVRTIKRQKMSFSPDSQKLIVATHGSDDCIRIRSWDCGEVPSQDVHLTVKAITTGPADSNGVSSIFYDHLNSKIFIAATSKIVIAATSRPYHMIIDGKEKGSLNIGDSRILGSAQSPVASQLVLIDHQQRIYRADLTTYRATLVMDLATQPQQRDPSWQERDVALAMPNGSTMYVLWTKGADLVLATVQTANPKAQATLTIKSLRECFDLANSS